MAAIRTPASVTLTAGSQEEPMPAADQVKSIIARHLCVDAHALGPEGS